MLGKRTSQRPLFDVGNVWPLELKAGSFHAQLAQAAARLFDDADFARFYAERLGRPSVPPSLLALVLLMQHEAGVSDQEAVDRTAYDLRWAAVLGRVAGEALCAKSTLQLFRAHLILHEAVRAIFLGSIREAQKAGLLKGTALRVALDTKPMQGRGAVLDTYNLLAEGIRQLARAMARADGQKPDAWLRTHRLARYTEASIKGQARIDWSDPQAREELLSQIVADARDLLQRAQGRSVPVREAAKLLSSLLLQDVQQTESADGPKAQIREGTAKGRIPSVADPQMRHGHKSKKKLFCGHKAAIVADTDSQIILAAELLAGDAPDREGALALVEQAEENTGQTVCQTLADCAYGDGETRQAFEDAGRVLHAKVAKEPDRGGLFPKSAFRIDADAGTCTCPEGQTTRLSMRYRGGGRVFYFGRVCAGCPMKAGCIRVDEQAGVSRKGRSVAMHPQEALLSAARASQRTPEGLALLRQRVVVEHRLARLGQLGVGQARYRGRTKSRFQLLMAATVANLRRTWNWQAQALGTDGSGTDSPADGLWSPLARAFVRCLANWTARRAYRLAHG